MRNKNCAHQGAVVGFPLPGPDETRKLLGIDAEEGAAKDLLRCKYIIYNLKSIGLTMFRAYKPPLNQKYMEHVSEPSL